MYNNIIQLIHYMTCNKIYDVPYDIASDIADNVWKKTGFSIEKTELSFHGICKNCQTKN